MPWDLISAALQNNLSHEQNLLFEQWLSATPANQKEFNKLKTIWDKGLDEYPYYQGANVTSGWSDLHEMITEGAIKMEETVIVRPVFKKQILMRWVSIAAIFIVILGGIIFWYVAGANKILYETAENEEKNIILPDGTTVLLKPQTQIQVDKHYNINNRNVLLNKGEAFFNVQHLKLPFIVNIKKFSVRDIGTGFTLKDTKDSIELIVVSGKVAFTSNRTNETREVSVGMSLSSNITNGNFGEITLLNKEPNRMHFNNTSLIEVIDVLEKTYHKKIELQNTILDNKRLTAQLDGLTFETALKIICKSLNLTYTENHGEYLLQQKN